MFQGQYVQYGGVVRGVDGYGVVGVQVVGNLVELFVVYVGVLGQVVVMVYVQVLVIEYDVVVWCEVGFVGFQYYVCQIDVGNQWKCLDDWIFVGECECIFVVECGVFDLYQDVIVYQICFIEIDQFG